MRIRTAILSIILALALIALVSGIFLKSRLESSAVRAVVSEPETQTVVSEEGFSFEVVASTEARTRGLGGRTEIPANYGMLFVFPEAKRYGFWMKDMYVSIDIVWLKNDGTVIGIDANVSPESFPDPYFAPEPVARVLETRAGEAAAQGWVVGSRIELPL